MEVENEKETSNNNTNINTTTNNNEKLYNESQNMSFLENDSKFALNKESTQEESTEKIDDHIFINEFKLGVQKNDLKFANFDDPYINPILLTNINYQNTLDEFNNLISILRELEEKYDYLISFKKTEIFETSNKYGICPDVGRIYIIGLRRIIELTLYIIKTRFCPLEKEEIIKIVKENYIFSNDIYINNFLNYKNLKNLVVEDDEKLINFIDNIKIIKEIEDKLANYIYNDFVPSITGIYFAAKSIMIYIEDIIKDCEILMNNIIEEVVIELLLNVK